MAKPSRLLRAFPQWQRIPEVVRAIRDSPQWFTLVLGYLEVGGPEYPFEFETRSHDKLLLHTYHDLVTAWIIFFRDEYRVDPVDQIILDVGANIGAFSLFASRRAPRARILALEPFPATLEQLRDNLDRNNLAGRVEIHSLALTSEVGARHMDDNSGPSQYRGMLGAGDGRGLEVRTVTLDRFLTEYDLNDIDLMKMDIEGSEHEVIRSTAPEVLRRIRRIALEYHPNEPKGPLFEHLHEAGFDLIDDLVIGKDVGVASFECV